MCPGPNHVFQIWWRSVQGFSVGWGSNFAIYHWLRRSSLQHSHTTVWYHRLRGVLTVTHHSYGSLAWLSDFFSGSPLEVRPPTDFDAKLLKRHAFTQGWYFCSKNRNFSYSLISRAPKRSKFCKFLDLEIFRSFWPLTLEVRERTPLIIHRSSMKVT